MFMNGDNTHIVKRILLNIRENRWNYRKKIGG